MVTSSTAALTGPWVAATTPAGSCGCTCTATAAPTSSSSRTPEPATSRPPEGSPSSRGCSTASTGAGPPTRRTARHTATSAARCTSCPQACITPPGAAQGTPVASLTASPSSSARSATVGVVPGSTRTTRPVIAVGRPGQPPDPPAGDLRRVPRPGAERRDDGVRGVLLLAGQPRVGVQPPAQLDRPGSPLEHGGVHSLVPALQRSPQASR